MPKDLWVMSSTPCNTWSLLHDCLSVLLIVVIFNGRVEANCEGDGCGPYIPYGPLVKCSYLPVEFVECEDPKDLKGNDTMKEELGYGCTKFGGQRYEDVEKTRVLCKVLAGIECHGNRTFMKDGVPCVKYSGHYFVTTLIYSVLLGFIGLDRFCLGHTGTAVGKLLTLGGVGIWWIVDIVLLVTGGLMPEDGSNWEPYV